jgi:branched-chain amino acid transport system permease protein
MDLVLQLFVNGIITGSHYALLAVGFGIIFATTRIVHFAYGPIFTVAAYMAWYSAAVLGLPLPWRCWSRYSRRCCWGRAAIC